MTEVRRKKRTEKKEAILRYCDRPTATSTNHVKIRRKSDRCEGCVGRLFKNREWGRSAGQLSLVSSRTGRLLFMMENPFMDVQLCLLVVVQFQERGLVRGDSYVCRSMCTQTVGPGSAFHEKCSFACARRVLDETTFN